MSAIKNLNLDEPVYINSSARNASLKFGTAFLEHLRHFYTDYSDIILLCIGTDRATGDSLGPLIGYKLSDALNRYKSVKVFGTLEKPVHATNIASSVSYIYNSHKNPIVIAIDSCLGDFSRIGYLSISKGGVKPGAGTGKNLARVGNISITGVVNYSSAMELVVLQNTRLNVIMGMADVISGGIYYGLTMLFNNNADSV